MGFYFIQKDQVLNPLDCAAWLQPVDRSLKAVDRAVDRRAQTCMPVLAGGPVDRPGRPSRELCSLESPGRPGRSTGRELYSLFQAAVDRAGRPKLQRSEF